MTNIAATETAYKNGYEQGKSDAIKHGHWIFSGDDDEFMNCSVCGLQRYSYDADNKSDITNYCPYCGAKMDEAG